MEAGRATYASGDESVKCKESDGSTTIRYSRGEYCMHDNYFGGEPYGGREVVFLNDKAVWMMVYYGLVYEGPNKEVYQFLMSALSNNTLEMPYRGPVILRITFGNMRILSVVMLITFLALKRFLRAMFLSMRRPIWVVGLINNLFWNKKETSCSCSKPRYSRNRPAYKEWDFFFERKRSK